MLKKLIPGFSHSQTSGQILEMMKSKITEKFKAMSLDGSGFDSCQEECLMKAVDH